ncbi:carbohydrate ABC transporter permease [Brachybacterium sacelli]|uniref:Raffinose/stachyose/melibiose transport system permease protein n=1 Tax=Brachybacterium sacelli TaxID=173364 RepID=A0ABS4WZZ6_9MICO|nr:carbohydrate ABC transporter permease [Brachybacterium sacelli]MBP2381779.1 raffinose/stachyose/melibiose transport system permease protein [Brachybacterium sacelli]
MSPAPTAPDTPRPRRERRRRVLLDWSGLPRGLLLAVYALLVAVPLVVVVLTALKTSQQMYADPFGLPPNPSLANFTELLRGGRIGISFVNSVLVTSVSVVTTLVVASWAAFSIARIGGRLGLVLFAGFSLGLAVPAQVAMIPQYVIFDQLGLTNSLLGLILINIAVTCSVAIFILTGFFRTLPGELFEAAEIDGASTWQLYWRIALPLSTPSLAAVAIFLFVMHWNDLLYPLLFISDPDKATLPKALLDFKGEYTTNYPVLFAGVIIASIPMIVAYVLLQRWFVAGITAGAVRG